MKRFFLLIAVVLLCAFTNVQGFVQKDTTHNNITFEVVASDSYYIISGPSDLLHHVANKENGQPTLPRLFPTFSKFQFAGFPRESETGFNRKSQISKYVYYAKCHIKRLEGTDIIYPFNYFW